MTLSITIQKTGSHNFEKYAVQGHASSHESGRAPAAPHSAVSRHWSHDWDTRLRLLWNMVTLQSVLRSENTPELEQTLRWKIALCLIGRPNHGWSSHEKASIKWWPTVRAIAETEASWDGVLAVLAEQAMMMLLMIMRWSTQYTFHGTYLWELELGLIKKQEKFQLIIFSWLKSKFCRNEVGQT